MNTKQLLTTGLLLGGLAVVGCKSEEPAKPSTALTQPAAMGKPTKPEAPTTPEATTRPALPAKEMTHVISTDTPFSATAGGPAGGTLAKGTKVLVLLPGSSPQVETVDGQTVYLAAPNYESLAPPPPLKPIFKPIAPAKEMTHVLSKDQPYTSAPGGPAAGTLKAGTKVLLLIPGSTAQVETADGLTVYTSNDGVDVIPPPKK